MLERVNEHPSDRVVVRDVVDNGWLTEGMSYQSYFQCWNDRKRGKPPSTVHNHWSHIDDLLQVVSKYGLVCVVVVDYPVLTEGWHWVGDGCGVSLALSWWFYCRSIS